MSHPYTTADRVRLFAIAQHVDHYLDRDGDGLADASLAASVIERGCNTIDTRLGRRYVVPFASISSSPPTPGKVADICDRLVLVYLLESISGASDETKRHWDVATAELDAIARGDDWIDAVEVSLQSRRPIRYESSGTRIAGRVGGDYSSRGIDKLRGV